MDLITFREKLKTNMILMDGAMGTYYEKLYPGQGIAEKANLLFPDRIGKIHREYLDAGAEVIRTNTFAVNHMIFSDEEIPKAIKAACEQARIAVEESGREALAAGSIGPIREDAEDGGMRVMTQYHQIVNLMLEQGIRLFVLETFSEPAAPAEIAKFIKLQSRVMQEDVYVQVQYALNRAGYTQAGFGMRGLLREAEKNPYIDGAGFNCGIGGTHMYRLLSDFSFDQQMTLSILPNAGYEYHLRGHQVFREDPEYFCEQMQRIFTLGVNITGGCCGTTPEYTRLLRRIIDEDPRPRAKRIMAETAVPAGQKSRTVPETAAEAEYNPNESHVLKPGLGTETDERTVPRKKTRADRKKTLSEKLAGGEKVCAVEIDAPFDHHAERFLAAADILRGYGTDLVTISDSPMGRARAESLQMSILLESSTGLTAMPHICGRDRNLIGLRSAILGGYINGIRNYLLITGDPVPRADRNIITSVFDVNSIRLMEYVRQMNEELFEDDPVVYGGALNYAGANPEGIAKRMRRKMEAGCSFFLTQPVYSAQDMERVRLLREMTGARILVGIMPLVSYRNARFMQNEMPGINVPDEIVARYTPDMSREEAEAAAVEIGIEIGRRVENWADGYYFMTPFNRAELVGKIIEALRNRD